MKINLCKKQEAVLRDFKPSKMVHVKDLMKEKKGITLKQASKELESEYRGTLKRKSTARSDWVESSSGAVEIGHLSDAMCAQVASYYRVAVQRNRGDIQSIIQAVTAIPLHLGANDNNADENHRFCPFTKDSWCQYQAAKFANKPLPHHPNYLSEAAVKIIFDVYEEFKLTTPAFIQKVSDGRTSNHNETIHSILFEIVPKTVSVGADVMRLGAALAVIIYNDGYNAMKYVFETMGITPGVRLSEALSKRDNERIMHSGQIIRRQQKKFAKKQRRGKKVKIQISKHGAGYSSGKYTAARKDSDTDGSGIEDTRPTSSTAARSDLDSESEEIVETRLQTLIVATFVDIVNKMGLLGLV